MARTGRVRSWFNGKVGRFVLTQLAHTAITVLVVAAIFFGVARAGALNSVLAPAAQKVPTSMNTINYQGRLADINGQPISDTMTLQFSLYDQISGGNALWTENQPNIPVSSGLFSVRLGSQSPDGIPINVFSSGDVWLEINVEGETLSPREKLAAVPYAMVAGASASNFLIRGANLYFGNETDDNVALRADDSDILHILPWGGSGHRWNKVAIGAGSYGGTNLEIFGDLVLYDQMPSIFFNAPTQDYEAFRDDHTGIFHIVPFGDATHGWQQVCIGCAGRVDLNVSGSISHGALIERNLQTREEVSSARIASFSQGDLLCWDAQASRLATCATIASPLVVAVADTNGKPIVLGAEPVKVLGPVQPGDLLVASDVPGYAVAWSRVGAGSPPVGVVIAKALEEFTGEKGIVKAMIQGR